MPRTKDTQLRSIYEKFNKFRDTSNVLSEQMNPREKRQLESSFRAIETNIDYIKQEIKIISKLLMKQGMKKSVKDIQQSFKRKVKEGKVILTKGGGYTTSKESQDEADELFGKARSRFGFNPSGKKKGGKIKTYAKGGGVRKPKMTAGY